MRTQTARSAGGVVVDGEGRVALIRVRRGTQDRWVLPKGTVEAGERPEDAALREVREETGLEAEVVEPLRTIDYWFVSKEDDVRLHKYVHFFLMRAIGGDVADHDEESEEARWFFFDEAAEACTFASERDLVRSAAERATGRAGSPAERRAAPARRGARRRRG